jgi:hypothetical protein
MSLASFWVFWKKHQHLIGEIVVGILLFAAGWQAGRVMSPYYAASPIVFQEAPDMPAGANTGSTESLIALQEAGEQQKGTAPAQVAAATIISPANSAGEPTQPVGESEQKLYAGSKNSNLYHHKDCPDWKRIKEENLVWWPTKEAAEAAGYTSSKCTQGKLNNT